MTATSTSRPPLVSHNSQSLLLRLDHLQEKFVTKNSNSTPAPIVVAPSVAAVREIDTHDDDEVQLYSIPQQESKYEDDLSIFRQQRPSCNSYEIEEMWTLKRANAVFEDDECSDDASEDDEIYQSPSKKQCQKLKWDQCCLSSSDDDTISFDLLSAASSTANDFYFR